MINQKKNYINLTIIFVFFIIQLVRLPIKVQAIPNISINLKTPVHEEVINDKEIKIDGEIESISKLKSV
ncbi:hypothetical protein NSA27_13665, partial [Clostridium tepidum]